MLKDVLVRFQFHVPFSVRPFSFRKGLEALEDVEWTKQTTWKDWRTKWTDFVVNVNQGSHVYLFEAKVIRSVDFEATSSGRAVPVFFLGMLSWRVLGAKGPWGTIIYNCWLLLLAQPLNKWLFTVYHFAARLEQFCSGVNISEIFLICSSWDS